MVIGAAVLLFIASLLDFYSADGVDLPSVWDTDVYHLALPTVFLTAFVAAGLLVGSRFLPQGRGLAGVPLPAWGTVLAVSSVWAALWSLITCPSTFDLGAGAVISFLATLAIAGVPSRARDPGARRPADPGPGARRPRRGLRLPAPAGQRLRLPGRPAAAAVRGDPPAGPAVRAASPPPTSRPRLRPPPPTRRPAADFTPLLFAFPGFPPSFRPMVVPPCPTGRVRVVVLDYCSYIFFFFCFFVLS
ncbi:DUF5336 domain-containing protein, partial [Streptomyces sp. Mg1]|uniref:DUF5336 domain-containing protein n=1 Tax=Streptomyces sp. Mg1 TaxID=465541 RepID=UPI001F315D24